MTFVSKDEVEAARSVNIVEFLLKNNEPLLQQGRYWRHEIHDSLVIKDDNNYSWNSQNLKGYGLISFCKDFYGMSFTKAVKTINSQNLSPEKITTQKQKSSDFSFSEVNDTSRVRHYLIHERKISEKLVNHLINKKIIGQDNRGNVIYKWADFSSRKIVGKELEGCASKKFRHIVPTNKEHYGFNLKIGKPETVFCFESPVDLLSYLTIHKNLNNCYLISMNGLKPKTLLYAISDCMKAGHIIKNVEISVDNDKAGNEFYQKISGMLNPEVCKRNIPKAEGFDWNDVLKHSVSTRERQKLYAKKHNNSSSLTM